LSRHPPITLRYFDARGRAQFLRYYFRIREVPFTDDRVPVGDDLAAWRALRGDRARTGPFHKLPILHWGHRLIAETLMISAFIHDAFSDARQLSDDDNLRHGMLTSSLCSDVMSPIATLLWADLAFAGADMRAASKRTLERLQQQFAAIDQSLHEWQWLPRSRKRSVMLADCLLWEEIDVAKQVFGPHFKLADFASLASFYDEFPGRDRCAALLREQACQITARPQENDAIVAIQAALG
jgi:glutathione S-transferase